ncbi:MAG: fumarylacetoacetate hydrolase family protein [Negativicutes bacterium]|nr:fumarylacetoacetate hydrolase family protein [Negativicutes bacterium]
MYFVNYAKDGAAKLGVLTKDQAKIIPLQVAEQHLFGGVTLPNTMLEAIEGGEAVLKRVQEVAAGAEADAACPQDELATVKVLAPIPRPAKNIFCIGKNYREHALEFEKTKDAAVAIPQFPVIFSKAATAVIGPDDVVNSHPGVTEQIDYEAELAVVIGKKGINIPKEEAMDYVFGYMILNDVTARDLQKKHGQWFHGKSLDTFAPTGPYLVHKSSVAQPDNLNVVLRINGEVRQNANTRDLIFDIPTIIATISEGTTIEPGDIIATGTPAGVAMGFNPPKFLKPGDVMEIEITGLGKLANKIG